MSTFDDASLVFIPSGYKTSKAYSVKPIDGTGDLTFTRSNSTASRVASNGLIEKVRTNLILQSQAFNTTWTSISASVTANTTANPLNGAVDADTITLTGATTQKYVTQAFSLNGNYTASVYLKAGTHQFAQFLLGTDTAPIANFDLTNGTSSATNSTAKIVSVGGGWYRCSMSFTSTTGTTVFILAVDSLSASRFATTASTGTLIAFGYQLETGDIATDYIVTTTAAVSVGPVANVPRLDYLNSSCPRLLLEPQRQNVITFSEQMDNAAWNKIQSSVTANAGTSPDGYTNADKFIPNTSNVIHFVTQTISSVSASWTYSIFAKAAGYDRLILNAFNTNYVGFNLTSGIVESSLGTGVTSANIENYGNGWYRCSITSTSTATGTNVAISVFNAAYTNGNTNPQFAGNGTDGILIYGAQLEQGSYSTSLIPTLGAAVTRGADACSKTGISSLIGQTEGTLFVDFVYSAKAGNNRFSISDGSSANWIFIGTPEDGSTNVSRFYIKTNNTVHVDVGVSSYFTFGQRYKLALAYKSGNWAVYGNGTLLYSGTDSIPAVSSPLSVFNFFSASGGVCDAAESMNQALLFKTRLSNSDLAALTTL